MQLQSSIFYWTQILLYLGNSWFILFHWPADLDEWVLIINIPRKIAGGHSLLFRTQSARVNNTEQNIVSALSINLEILLKCLACTGCHKHQGILNKIPSILSSGEHADLLVQEMIHNSCQCACLADKCRTAFQLRLILQEGGWYPECQRAGATHTFWAERNPWSSRFLYTY